MTADLTLTGRTPCSAQCENCTTSISAAFRPCMLHHYSDILGYLDLQNTTAVDLVLQECELTVGCLSCSQEGPMQVTKHVMLNIPEQLRCEISCNRKQMFFSIRTLPMDKQRSSTVKTATPNSASWLRALNFTTFSLAPIKQVRAHLHMTSLQYKDMSTV